MSEKNKILINDEDELNYNDDNENGNDEEYDEYQSNYENTINNIYLNLINYVEDNNIPICEYLKINDIELFLQHF